MEGSSATCSRRRSRSRPSDWWVWTIRRRRTYALWFPTICPSTRRPTRRGWRASTSRVALAVPLPCPCPSPRKVCAGDKFTRRVAVDCAHFRWGAEGLRSQDDQGVAVDSGAVLALAQLGGQLTSGPAEQA